LNISALDKTTSKLNCITIINDKGCLSKEEIEHMVSEAEKYKSEDEAASARITAKNSLESYLYNLHNSSNGEKLSPVLAALLVASPMLVVLAEGTVPASGGLIKHPLADPFFCSHH
jgi:hypothetical protein